jgi:UDP-N-acetyl-D-mannosaminuronate dehydrogenase
MNQNKIAIIGLGYVGLPLAVEFAKKYKVIGFDINSIRVDELNKGTDHTLEVTSDDPTRRRPDITKAKEILNWEPKIDRK